MPIDPFRKNGFKPSNGGAAKPRAKKVSVSKSDIETMLDSYITTALWSSTDNSNDSGGDPLDDNYGPDDLTKKAFMEMRKDVTAFARENAALIGDRWARAGHDFWLTHNGHGAGFWDGDWPEPAGSVLTKNSKPYGSVDLYVGDDKKIHSS